MKFAYRPPKLSLWNSAHLNMIRSAATLAVVAEHSLRIEFMRGQPVTGPMLSTIAVFSKAAGEAVMVFFVLSGFLIASTVLGSKDTFTWKRYLIDRGTRLYVVLLPALLLTAGVDLLTDRTMGASHFLDNVLTQFIDSPIAQHHTLGIFFGNLAFLQTVLVPAFGSDLPLWSLSSEFWYYLVFPLSCSALFAGDRLRRYLSAFGIVLWLLFFPQAIVKYFLIWLLGVVVYLCPAFTLVPFRRQILIWLSAFTMAFVLYLPTAQSLTKWQLDCAFSLAFSLYLFFLTRTTVATSEVLPLYRTIGTGLAACSYSVYVTHFPLLVFLRSWRKGVPWQLTPVYLAYSFLIIAGLVITGWAFSRLTETHTTAARHLLLRWIDRPSEAHLPSVPEVHTQLVLEEKTRGNQDHLPGSLAIE